ncbi:putative RNA helicase [Helianthus debilis subsp. tardiflorus]
MDTTNLVKERSQQRFPVLGEPICVVCGKYEEYTSVGWIMLFLTDDDMSSMDCKTELLENLKLSQGPRSNQSIVEASCGPKVPLQVFESGGDTWDFNRHHWSTRRSSLSTYEWYIQLSVSLHETIMLTCFGKMARFQTFWI